MSFDPMSPAATRRGREQLPAVVVAVIVLGLCSIVIAVLTLVQNQTLLLHWAGTHPGSPAAVLGVGQDMDTRLGAIQQFAPAFIPTTIGATVLVLIPSAVAIAGSMARRRWSRIPAIIAAAIGALFAVMLFAQSRTAPHIVLAVLELITAAAVIALAVRHRSTPEHNQHRKATG